MTGMCSSDESSPLAQDIQTAHLRHADIQKNDIGFPSPQQLDGFAGPRRGNEVLVTLILQVMLNGENGRFLVIDDHDIRRLELLRKLAAQRILTCMLRPQALRHGDWLGAMIRRRRGRGIQSGNFRTGRAARFRGLPILGRIGLHKRVQPADQIDERHAVAGGNRIGRALG